LCASSHPVGVKLLGGAEAMFIKAFWSQTRQLVFRAFENFIPATVGLKRFKDRRSKVVLLARGQLGDRLKSFFLRVES